MKNEHHIERDDRDDGAHSDAATSAPPGGGAQTEQEPARARAAAPRTMPPRPDADIRAALDALLRATDAVDPTGIELLVTNGVVAMLGEVASYQDKRALELAVAEVPGVREIHDQLQVRSGPDLGAAGLRGDPPPNGSSGRVV